MERLGPFQVFPDHVQSFISQGICQSLSTPLGRSYFSDLSFKFLAVLLVVATVITVLGSC